MTDYVNKSAKTDRIALPCNLNDEIQWAAALAVWKASFELGDIKDIVAYLAPHISRNLPSIGYLVEIVTTSDQRITKRIKAETTLEEYKRIIDGFFNADAPGLNREYAECYKRQYDAWSGRTA